MTLLLFGTIVFVPMAIEALVSGRNERQLRAQGATEPRGDVYPVMQVAYPGLFLLMFAEGWVRRAPLDVLAIAGFTLFVAAKLLKYWAILTLGSRWTFRVLVPPGSALITTGPYQVLRHPNYVAVVAELAGAALLVHAFVTGVLAICLFGLLLMKRIRVEERALTRDSA